jgi:Methyltransferase domain
MAIDRAAVQSALLKGFIGAPNARPRLEDETKIDELVALLKEVERVLKQCGRREPLVLVDAAAGKGYLGILAAHLIFGPLNTEGKVVLIERQERLLRAARFAVSVLQPPTEFEFIEGDVSNLLAWPQQPTLVVGLHACGGASDSILDGAIVSQSKHLLLVPCCVSAQTPGTQLGERIAQVLAFPKCPSLKRKLLHATVDAERVLRLESQGYHTETVDFVSARVTPWNTLLRAKRVGEPVRSKRGEEALAKLRAFSQHNANSVS